MAIAFWQVYGVATDCQSVTGLAGMARNGREVSRKFLGHRPLVMRSGAEMVLSSQPHGRQELSSEKSRNCGYPRIAKCDSTSAFSTTARMDVAFCRLANFFKAAKMRMLLISSIASPSDTAKCNMTLESR
jgi:hypothetical protein